MLLAIYVNIVEDSDNIMKDGTTLGIEPRPAVRHKNLVIKNVTLILYYILIKKSIPNQRKI